MSYVHLLGAQLVTYCAAVHKEATSSMLALLVMGVPALMVSYW